MWSVDHFDTFMSETIIIVNIHCEKTSLKKKSNSFIKRDMKFPVEIKFMDLIIHSLWPEHFGMKDQNTTFMW
jgi:hypothetical protein